VTINVARGGPHGRTSGPALPIIRYTDLEQAVEWANGVDVGPGASVWSADRDTALAIAARPQAGTEWINSHGGIDPRVPFGGAKVSGYGLEFGVEGTESRIRPAGHQRLGLGRPLGPPGS
jgi:acyl-CoA reductase-like NAD-dependent aldehyde dehydrogenase